MSAFRDSFYEAISEYVLQESGLYVEIDGFDFWVSEVPSHKEGETQRLVQTRFYQDGEQVWLFNGDIVQLFYTLVH